VLESIDKTKQVRAVTRRGLLTRDVKALCAMVAAPTIAQLMFPNPASARDGWGGRGSHWGHGGHHDHDDGHGGPGYGEHGHGEHGHGEHGGHGSGKCFLRGTRILTADGERKVEDLAVGDRVTTAFGGTRPIQWIGGFRRLRSTNGSWAKHARPVRIARSALAPDVPHTDLFVSQGHALLFDDVLVPAGSLINDKTITLHPADEHDELVFFHLKLDAHDVIYAEGAPCETLLEADETAIEAIAQAFPRRTTEAPARHCMPIICNGPGREFVTRLRSLATPWLGPQRFDDIRMQLELRAMDVTESFQSGPLR
jgi:hypothetical protein